MLKKIERMRCCAGYLAFIRNQAARCHAVEGRDTTYMTRNPTMKQSSVQLLLEHEPALARFKTDAVYEYCHRILQLRPYRFGGLRSVGFSARNCTSTVA